MITTKSRTMLVSLAVGAAVVAGTGAASADTTPTTPATGSSSLLDPVSGATASGTYSALINSVGSTNGLAGAIYPSSPLLANLVCVFGGGGSSYYAGLGVCLRGE